MFIPALEEKLKKEKEKPKEMLLELPDYKEEWEEYHRKRKEQEKVETVITVQII